MFTLQFLIHKKVLGECQGAQCAICEQTKPEPWPWPNSLMRMRRAPPPYTSDFAKLRTSVLWNLDDISKSIQNLGMAREYDHLFKLLIIGDSGKYHIGCLVFTINPKWRTSKARPRARVFCGSCCFWVFPLPRLQMWREVLLTVLDTVQSRMPHTAWLRWCQFDFNLPWRKVNSISYADVAK